MSDTEVKKFGRYTRAEVESILTPEYLRVLFSYDEHTGVFTRRMQVPDAHYSEHACKMLNARDAGKPVGSLDAFGYLKTQILGHKFLLHRIAWRWLTGEWPDAEIDHIDGNPSNNAADNLRAVSHTHNVRNAARRSDNTSGVTGVWWDSRAGRWLSYLRYNKKLLRLGLYEDFNTAVEARKQAEEIYGFHENHGARARMTRRAAGASN